MIKLKHILTEKKELNQSIIDKIAKLTDRNNHTIARMELADRIPHKQLSKMYKHIYELHMGFGAAPRELLLLRDKLDKTLFKMAKSKFSNFKDINSAF